MTEPQVDEHPPPADGGDVCRSTATSGVADAGPAGLIYEPWATERPDGRIEIWGKRENPDVIPWGFWGGVLVAAAIAGPIFFGISTGNSLWDILLLSVVLMTGLVLFRLGRRSTLDEEKLCEIDVEHRIISWPTPGGGAPLAVAFDDVEDLRFGIVEVSVDSSRSGARLDAASVEVLDDRGRAVSVVEASTSKDETHRIARLFADLLGRSVNYVGTGVREWV